MGTYNAMPKKVAKSSKGPSKIILVAMTTVIGLMAGYFVPFEIFA